MGKTSRAKRIKRQPFETAAFNVLKCVIPFLPRPAIVGLARIAGSLSWRLPLKEKQIGIENINAVFGNTKTDTEKRRILTRSFATFCQTMLDVIWFSFRTEKRILNYVEFEPGPLTDAFFEDKAMICITAHLGSWEIFGQASALNGADLASIAAPLKNAAIDRMMIKQRERTGQTIIPRKGAVRALISRLRKGGKTAFVLDQNTKEENGGILVDFLGLPMPVSSAPAAMAYRTGTEVLIGLSLPRPGGRYLLRFEKSIVPPPFDKEADSDAVIQKLTQQILDELSAAVRRYPEFWLWSYKHWRRKPGQEYPAHYPSY